LWHFAIRVPQEALRAIPVLVLLVWLHYLVPSTFGITPSPLLTTAIVLTAVVTLSAGEVIRSAITSIPAAEVEAALMLGLTRSQVVRKISIPLALRASTPGLLLLYADTLKLSTFASVIALGELLHTTDVIIQQTYLAVPAYTALALIFLATIVPLNLSAQSLARRWAYRR
jgi:polar amino acid transport system permease protein